VVPYQIAINRGDMWGEFFHVILQKASSGPPSTNERALKCLATIICHSVGKPGAAYLPPTGKVPKHNG
jgi:hypothetical protein